jgi:hypothetical protein
VAGNHLVICREAADGKFEVREYNSFKGRIEMALERCDTLKQGEKALGIRGNRKDDDRL